MQRLFGIFVLGLVVALLSGCIIEKVSPDPSRKITMNRSESVDFVLTPTRYNLIRDYEWTVTVNNKDFLVSSDGEGYRFTPTEGGCYQIRCVVNASAQGSMDSPRIQVGKVFFVWNVEVNDIALQPYQDNISAAPGESIAYKATAYPEGPYQYAWRLDGQVVSTTESFTFQPTAAHIGMHMLEITAMDAYGTTSLTRQIYVPFATAKGSSAKFIQPTNDGGWIVAGETWSLLTGSDISVFKFDAHGAVEWHRTYGGPDFEYVESIQQTNDAGYIVGGYSLTSGPYRDAYLIKLNDAGGIVWKKKWSLSISERLYSLQPTNDGGYIITDGSVTKLDPQGTLLWSKQGGLKPRYVQQTADGGFIGTGPTKAFRLDAAGDVVWSTTISSDGPPEGPDKYTIRQMPDGTFIVNSFPNYRETLIKLSSSGEILWQWPFQDMHHLSDFQPISDGGYILTGDMLSGYCWRYATPDLFDLNACRYVQHTDGLLLKVDSSGNPVNGQTLIRRGKSLSLQSIAPQAQQGFMAALTINNSDSDNGMDGFCLFKLDAEGNL
jgi:hypothetical protein